MRTAMRLPAATPSLCERTLTVRARALPLDYLVLARDSRKRRDDFVSELGSVVGVLRDRLHPDHQVIAVDLLQEHGRLTAGGSADLTVEDLLDLRDSNSRAEPDPHVDSARLEDEHHNR